MRELIVTNYHPLLAWLAGLTRSRTVPAHVAKQMANLKSPEQAQAFVASAGLQILTETRRAAPSANSVSVAAPESVDEYYAPQIVLPKIDCPDVPSGTALMNVLLPETSDPAGSEKIFQEYQAMVLAFSHKLEALPFACITGHKMTAPPPHDLYLRGFRFFFSPQPDCLHQRIYEILNTRHKMIAARNNAEEARRLAVIFLRLKFCAYEGGEIGHSLLEDVKFTEFGTTLVDLR